VSLTRLAPIVVVLLLASASQTTAQIYTWTDPQGVMMLSNRPRAGSGGMALIPGSSGRPVEAPMRFGATEKSRPYDQTIERQATKHGVSPELVRAVIQVESAFNPNAISPKGAMGLMQLMPATATQFGVTNPFHPEQNIGGGTAYLRQLLTRYGNKVDLALAAYNAGPGSVEKYGAVPPYSETRSYVRKVTATSGATAAVPPASRIYKWTETIDGRAVVRYSNKPPASGSYETVSLRR